ncbi:hypothetical protein JNB63_03070 [Microbacterium trichothecenolyticum]|nr:hypothetical protein [Microbacterium trichothecenolyticum]
MQGARRTFWTVAALGPLAAAVAWTRYGFAQYEAQGEQGKALSAGTTMAGFAEVIGGIPLVLAHIIGLAVLMPLGWFAYRGRGLAAAVAAVVVASIIGIVIAEVLFAGELFMLGIDNYDTHLP